MWRRISPFVAARRSDDLDELSATGIPVYFLLARQQELCLGFGL